MADERMFRIILLGAGFSRAAGMPLSAELWNQIRKIASRFSPDLRVSKFHDDLKRYCLYLRRCRGTRTTPDKVDFEEFMRFLDIEHFLGMRGGDTWGPEGNESTVVTKTLIGQILAERQNRLQTIPDLYLEFARRLESDDYVLTFNYDTLLERALEQIKKPFRLFPMRHRELRRDSAIVDDDKSEVVVLKMHGSIDWFDRAAFNRREQLHREMGAPPPTDVIFSNAEMLGLRPLLDGPRFDDDPLLNVYRASNLAEVYRRDIMFRATPRMLPPSAAKMVYANWTRDFWDGIGRAGGLNFGLAIVGFSLSAQDEYLRQVVYALVRNYQNVEWGKEVVGRRKPPMVLVDLLPDTRQLAAFKERYRFVNWKRATLLTAGFNQAAIDAIFQFG